MNEPFAVGDSVSDVIRGIVTEGVVTEVVMGAKSHVVIDNLYVRYFDEIVRLNRRDLG
jgi:hypothetical protein